MIQWTNLGFPIGEQLSHITYLEGRVLLSFESKLVIVKCLVDTDELEVSVESVELDFNEAKQLKLDILPSLHNLKLMAVWKGVNSQGYFDLITFGFNSLQPGISFLSEGSELKMFESVRVDK